MNCIVMPIYKKFEELIPQEIISINRLYSVLGKYPIYIIGSKNIDWASYISHAELLEANVNIKIFGESYFSSISGYNSLLLSLKFYKAFKSYEYLLLYQTDAFVFKDDFEYWCSLGFDYVGAPWFEGFQYALKGAKYIGIGNGGFSLRKVSSHIRVLSSLAYVNEPGIVITNFRKNMSVRGFLNMINDLTINNNTFHLFNKWSDNEDYFFGIIASTKFKWFSVPDLVTALKFSIEVHPEEYILSDADLPFGCHGWWKYNPDFWSKYIYTSNSGIE
jgi:Protein of unknown function (DUF5672)